MDQNVQCDQRTWDGWCEWMTRRFQHCPQRQAQGSPGKDASVVWILVFIQLTWRPRDVAWWFFISSANIGTNSIWVRRATSSAKTRSVNGLVPLVVRRKARWLASPVRNRSVATARPCCTPLPIGKETSLIQHGHRWVWVCRALKTWATFVASPEIKAVATLLPD